MTQRGKEGEDAARSESAGYSFSVTEYEDGTPWILLEPAGTSTSGGQLSVLGEGVLGLDMHEGVSFEEAKQLAEQLRGMVAGVRFTRFPDGR